MSNTRSAGTTLFGKTFKALQSVFHLEDAQLLIDSFNDIGIGSGAIKKDSKTPKKGRRTLGDTSVSKLDPKKISKWRSYCLPNSQELSILIQAINAIIIEKKIQFLWDSDIEETASLEHVVSVEILWQEMVTLFGYYMSDGRAKWQAGFLLSRNFADKNPEEEVSIRITKQEGYELRPLTGNVGIIERLLRYVANYNF